MELSFQEIYDLSPFIGILSFYLSTLQRKEISVFHHFFNINNKWKCFSAK